MAGFDVIIIGGGVMGLATACEAAQASASVALIEQAQLPNPRAASVDHSKVFRFAYPDTLYVRLAVDALGRWRALEGETGERLLTETGVLLIGHKRPSFETECYDALRSLGLECEMLDKAELARRYPQFNAERFDYGVYDPSGAILHAEKAVVALAALARRRGVCIVEGERVSAISRAGSVGSTLVLTESGSELEGQRIVVASGPWTRKLLPSIACGLTVTRQEVVYFEPAQQADYSVANFPIFIALDTGFYGFPTHRAGSLKVADHHKGEAVDPYSYDERVSDEFIAKCRAFFGDYIPGLARARVTETRACLYNNTPDDDFIIDWHPELEGVLIVTGFSGHGFKFGPTIGHIARQLALSGSTPYDIERFRLSRFKNFGEANR